MLGVCIRNSLWCRQGIGALHSGKHWSQSHTQMNLPAILTLRSSNQYPLMLTTVSSEIFFSLFEGQVPLQSEVCTATASGFRRERERTCSILWGPKLCMPLISTLAEAQCCTIRLVFQSWPHGPAQTSLNEMQQQAPCAPAKNQKSVRFSWCRTAFENKY